MFVVKVPGINGLGETNGCERAGNEILRILKDEIFSTESGREADFSTLDLEEIHLDNSNLELSGKLIYKNAFDIYSEKSKVVFLGGDHSISYNLTRAFFDYCQNKGKEPCLIVFDAHPDLMPVQIGSEKFPGNRYWLRQLIEDGFSPENILLVGVRNLCKDELDFTRDKKIKIISTDKIFLNAEDSCDAIMEFSNGKELYVSLDAGVLDSTFASATGFPEPGGLSSRELIYIFKRISMMKNLRASDIVEINPSKDEKYGFITTKLGARILAELCF